MKPAQIWNGAGYTIRNVTMEVIDLMARETGLEPATSGVTGRGNGVSFQRKFRVSCTGNALRREWRVGTWARPMMDSALSVNGCVRCAPCWGAAISAILMNKTRN